MIIQTIETFARRELTIVRVRTGDGNEGYGQTAPFNADITAQVLHRQIAPHVLGREIEDLRSLIDGVIQAEYKFPWSYVCRAAAGVETALWDLVGRRDGKSVCELLGQRRDSIPAYGSSMRRDIQPRKEARRLARLRDEEGFHAFKIRIGSVCGQDEDQWPGRTGELVPTVRGEIGEDVSLLVDANSCYTPGKAIEVGRMLEDNGVCHFEEPCPYWEIEWTAEVARELQVPVAGGEQDNSLAQWRRIVGMPAVDIVQPDICYIGGLSRALAVAQMAAEAGMPCVPHSANLSLVTVFTLHLLGAIANAGPYIEFSIEDTSWAEGIYEPMPRVEDGRVSIPDGPGWGVRVLPSWLKSSDYCISTAGD